jgi:hypothetical protein
MSLLGQDMISLREAAKRLPVGRNGKCVSLATLYRWASRGVRGIKLDLFCCGGRTVTSVQALESFIERVTAMRTGVGAAAQPARPTSSRRAAMQRANQRLDQLGIG